MTDDLMTRVVQVVADVLNVPADNLQSESSAEEIEAWDSISHLNLVLSLEQAFDVSFDPEKIPELVTVQKIADEIRGLS